MKIKHIVHAAIVAFVIAAAASCAAAPADKPFLLTRDRDSAWYVIDVGWCQMNDHCPKGRHLAVRLFQKTTFSPAIEGVLYVYHYTPDGKRWAKLSHIVKTPEFMGKEEWHDVGGTPTVWNSAGSKTVAGKAYAYAVKKMGLKRCYEVTFVKR